MGRVLKSYILEKCLGCGVLLFGKRRGYYCFIHDYPLLKQCKFNPDGPDKPECSDFIPKGETEFVIWPEQHQEPQLFGHPSPNGYVWETIGQFKFDSVIEVRPIGHRRRITDMERFIYLHPEIHVTRVRERDEC